jgi:alpha-tubulin suppressor-like RCC1 family protein
VRVLQNNGAVKAPQKRLPWRADMSVTSAAGSLTLALLAIVCVALGSATMAAMAAPLNGISWGENWRGELGTIYRNANETHPVGVEAPPGLIEVSSGHLGLYANGTVVAWGGNRKGLLGDGTHVPTWQKGVGYVTVHGLGPAEQVSAAGTHAMALERDGIVETWGNDQYGQQGTGASGWSHDPGVDQTAPNVVKLPAPVTYIASGGGSDFALLANGQVYAWGLDDQGQLGIAQPEVCPHTEIGPAVCSAWPQPVVAASGKPIEHVKALSAGYESGYALLRNGRVLAWGANTKGQLGDGGETLHSKATPPTEVRARRGPLEGVTQVVGGFNFALALLSNGEVVGWGRSEGGELGAGKGESCKGGRETCFLLARPIVGAPRSTAVAAGFHYSLALSAGMVYAWGSDHEGQLGNGRTEGAETCETVRGPRQCSPEPLPVTERSGAPVRGVQAISAGGRHAVALTTTPALAPLINVSSAHRAVMLSWLLPESERITIKELESSEPQGENESEAEAEGENEGENESEVEGESEGENEGGLGEPEIEHESVKLEGDATSYMMRGFGLHPYQVKLRAGGRNREFVVTP